MKRVLFIYAHLDDETILSYGTIAKLKADGNDIALACLCGLGRLNSDGNARLGAFDRIVQSLDVKKLIYTNSDLTLSAKDADICITDAFDRFKPDIVFTHSVSDPHWEHRIVAERVLLKCRKSAGSGIKELNTSVLPTYKWSYGQFGVFQPNIFIDITEYVDAKNKALREYSMELPEDADDLRSVESVIGENRANGRIMNTGYCEPYQMLFKLA